MNSEFDIFGERKQSVDIPGGGEEDAREGGVEAL